METAEAYFKTPVGNLHAIVDENGVRKLEIVAKSLKTTISSFPHSRESSARSAKQLKDLKKALTNYFSGDTNAFSKIPISLQGTTFQKKVWKQMRNIKPGKTIRYGDLAKKTGHPGAARAVGTACAKNPLLLIVPCHRVVATNGLGGFACGLPKKKLLLKHESSAIIQ